MYRAVIAVFVFICSLSASTVYAKAESMDPILAQSEWVLGLLPDGYYIAENADGTLILIKEGPVIIARALLPEEHMLLSCTRGTVVGNIITGTTITIVDNGDAAYTVIPVSGDTIDVSQYYLAGENQDDHMPDQYNWEDIHTVVDLCRDITAPTDTPATAQEVRAPAHP